MSHTPQAAYDVVVVGAGLAGLFAGTLAARRGARTLVIARGQGGTQLGAGTIGVWGFDGDSQPAASPTGAWAERVDPRHPLALAGPPALQSALAELQAVCAAGGYPMVGSPERNYFLPTALGAVRPACLVPESFAAGELRPNDSDAAGELLLAEVPGFRDFYAAYAAANLRAAGHNARAVRLELPRMPARRDAFATDLARMLDGERYRAEVARLWRPHLKVAGRLGLPAVLGYQHAADAGRDLSEKLGLPVFEIPLLPPSVPGMRLHDVLVAALRAAGGRIIVGPRVTGWLPDPAERQARVLGVAAETAGGPRRYAAGSVILATGGFRHGGLTAPAAGQARESVFDLPVATGSDWFAPLYWGAQPYARFGVRVNASMQPVAAGGEPIYQNVWAAGGLLAGADRRGEGSREGIDLASAWKAVEQCAPAAITEGITQ